MSGPRRTSTCTSLFISGVPSNLCDPVAEVVVVGDTSDLAIADLEERAARQHVALALGFRQPVVRHLVFAMHHVLRACTQAVGADHHPDPAQLLAIAAVHSLTRKSVV